MIPRHVREDAALICAIAASGGTVGYHAALTIARELGIEDRHDAINLAADAWAQAMVGRSDWTREVDAEAEALIRTGWSP